MADLRGRFSEIRLAALEKCPWCASPSREPFEHDPASPHPTHAQLCRSCGLVYMDKVPIAEDIPKLYSNFAGERTEDRELSAKRARMYALDHTFVRGHFDDANTTVLDIGCSTGEFLSRFTGSSKKYGIEPDPTARRMSAASHPDLILVDGFDALPKDVVFDAAIFRGSLQYLTDLRGASREVARRVRPGGSLFLLAIPNVDSLLAQMQREDWVLFDRYEHRYTFGIQQLKAMFAPAFEMVEYELPYLGTPYENYTEDYRAVIRMMKNPEARRERVSFFGSMVNMALRRVDAPSTAACAVTSSSALATA